MKATPKDHVLDFEALLLIDGWAGRKKYRINVIGETTEYVKFIALESIPMPKKWLKTGEIGKAPKYCVVEEKN